MCARFIKFPMYYSTESVVISVCNLEQRFSWEGYGLNLYFPKGSLPCGIRQCSVEIEATVEGNYIFPYKSYPVSAVYWFRCTPECTKFSKPVTIEIEHCAKPENLHALSFVKAKSEEGEGPPSQYIFRKALGCFQTEHGIFPSRSSYGFIQIDRFSGYSITQEGSDERQYCGNLYYITRGMNYEIHFAVIFNTETHRSVSYHIISCYYLGYITIST